MRQIILLRKNVFSWIPVVIVAPILTLVWSATDIHASGAQKKRPNILIAIADDQSYPHCSAYGCTFVNTPAFDRVAKEGALFRNGYAASCGCSPSRAALLTGRHTWQLQHAGTHASSFPTEYVVYPDLLQQAGYHVGYTGKPWGPGNWRVSGWKRNPAGPAYNSKTLRPPARGIRSTDYAENFKDFLAKRPKGAPFAFWFGASEPHRSYQKGIGLESGKKLKDVQVPAFLPDVEVIRSDLLDYAYEIEWFDRHLGKMIAMLEEIGELENTIIIVTADNGMPFPRAKANLYEYGTHVPFAVRWGDRVKGGRTIEDYVGFVDLAPTFLEAAGLKPHPQMTGKSLLKLLWSEKSGQIDPARIRAFVARERHSSSRVKNLGYPCRSLVKKGFLYIKNFTPDRWPAGDPRGVKGDPFGYYDIDACPSKTFLVLNKRKYKDLFMLAVGKRPAEELYDLTTDPANLHNLAADPKHQKKLTEMREELTAYLRQTGDPRVVGNGEIFETYRRYSHIRKFGD